MSESGINDTAYKLTKQKCHFPLAGQPAELVQCNAKCALTAEKAEKTTVR